ncbi:ribonuclease H-like domain-containing protein [Tanacetum coccineum]|uniref:Ribonuclease H-like domain-containing protein n=1 Tax=Tanacetum coccineum TaxID=301880 RepID=A0ABQ5DVS0_9ASTR
MTGSDDKIPTPPPSPKSSSDKLIPFGVTSITNNVPVKLDLEKMNYNSWSSFFKIHLGSIGLKDHIESDTVSSSDKEWSRLNDLVKVWILGTCCESLQDQVVSTPGTAKDLWDHIKDLFHDNEDARAIALDNQLRFVNIETELKDEGSLDRTHVDSSASSPTVLLAPNKNNGNQAHDQNSSKGTNGQPTQFCNYFSKVALSDPHWRDAMHDEYNALIKNSTWVLVPKPPNANVVRSMWLFRHKYHVDGSLTRLSFQDTIRTGFLACFIGRCYSQLNVKNAFLNGDLSEIVYMYQPSGFVDSRFPHHVCKLQRSLYGLKQAPRAWFQRFAGYALRVGFSVRVDVTHLCLSIVMVWIYVTRDSTGMFLSQRKYAMELLERAHMANCNSTRTPVDTESKLGSDGEPVSDPTLYRSLAGGLQYLTFTRPDISYAVQQICLFMHDPREPHMAALKRVLRYVQGTLDFGLQLYSSPSSSLVAYTDADWAGCPTTRRSTSGYCVFLGDNLLSWSAKRQHTLSRSSAEAEYRGVANVVAETAWIRNLLRELHSPLHSATIVYCDNVSAIYLTTNPVQHQRTKHIEIDIHFVRDMVARGQVRVLHVPSRYQYADIFTKGLPTTLFEEFRTSLSVRPPPAVRHNCLYTRKSLIQYLGDDSLTGRSTAVVPARMASERNLSTTTLMERIPRPECMLHGRTTESLVATWDGCDLLHVTMTMSGSVPVLQMERSRFGKLIQESDDKLVKCWDLEQNKVIGSYNGHLSGVYCLALHPTIDVLLTEGRDFVCRVWDIHSKMQIHAFPGHDNTICYVFTRYTDPQVISDSHDSTIKLWDLRYGKTLATLTHHKKSVRALAKHPIEENFASASKTIINAMTVNQEGVLATRGDNGSLWFWDWKSGHSFQQSQIIVQPGSLDSEDGIYALSYDMTRSRLVTCEADKTIKMWKQDEYATSETHPINSKPPKDIRRF